MSDKAVCILSPCLFKFYTEYLMGNPGLYESQAGIKISGTNTNFRDADDTTLMAEGEEELKSLLMRVKEESEKAGLKCNIKKTKLLASSPITSWQSEGEKWSSDRFILGGYKITVDGTAAMKLEDACSLEGKL